MIRTMLEQGSGADRQLKVFREAGSLRAVVDYMASETRAGL
jgi:carboxylate-amine ligase